MAEHPVFAKFKKVAILCKNSPNKEQILSFILQGTKHTNLAAYHSDKTISVNEKIKNYDQILGTFDPIHSQQGGLQYPKEVHQPSDVFGYTNFPEEDTPFDTSKHLPTSYQKALESELQALKGKVESLMASYTFETQLNKKLEEKLEELDEKRPKILEVKIDGQPRGSLSGEKFHKQLPLIVKLLASRNAMGFSEFIYIWGAPGSGKTHMAKQIAKCLGVRAYTYPVGPTITEGKLLGFNNIATGSFIAGWLYEAYKNGGLVALDEIDLADAAVLGATNSIENDAYIFGNGEAIERHQDFYLIAFANTQGTGNTKGFVRNILDAATRDRFTQIELEYDEELEKAIYGNVEWAQYVQKVREFVKTSCNSSVYITPRATRKGAAYLAAGVDIDTIMDITIFKSCSKDLKKSIIDNVGKFIP